MNDSQFELLMAEISELKATVHELKAELGLQEVLSQKRKQREERLAKDKEEIGDFIRRIN